MNILNKFTFRSIKLNKKRTIVTIVGIVLSTALICATAGLITSMQQTLINNAIKNQGDYHAEFINVEQKEHKYILENRNIESYMITQDVGYSELKGSTNKYKPYVYLKEYDKTSLNNLGIDLKEGRMPENENELLISQHIKTNGKVNWKVGDKVVLKIGKRYSDGYELNQNNPCYEQDSSGEAIFLENETTKFRDETIKVEFKREYTIVGIMSRPNFSEEGYEAPGYTVISYMDKIRNNANIYVKYKDIRSTYENTNVINGLPEDASTKEEGKFEVDYNKQVLEYSGVTKSSSTTETLYTVAGIVIAIIIGTSVFVIRNSFHISITEKYKQYGILASIGATSKQIKHNVLYEGFLIGIIAVPLGILSGIFATWILIIILNLILKDFANMMFVCKVSIPAVIVSIVMSTLTIYLSCLLPARKASKVSPIDAIRANNEIKIKAKKLRMPKIIKKLFGIGGEISWKNLKRSKKRYRTTVISIFVSIVVFLSLSSIMEYGFKVSGIYYKELEYNIAVNDDISTDEIISFKDILNLDNVDRFNIPKSAQLKVDFKHANTEYPQYKKDEEDGAKGFSAVVYSISDEEYKRYLKENKLDENEYKNKAILIDLAQYYVGEQYHEVNALNVNEGDFVEGKIMKYNTNTKENEEVKDLKIQVGKRLEKAPMGINTYIPILIISDDIMEQIGNYTQRNLYIQSNDAFKLQDDIEAMNKEIKRWSVFNIEEDKKQNDAIILIISIFLYGFISVITLIGVTNIFNTITTNMALRSKEFAMLKSIGMTNREFNKMIRLESVFYGMKSLVLGIPVGLILSYLIYNSIIDKYSIKYVFPYWQVALCIVFVFVIVFITMKYSLVKINKQNIIETIRNENV